MLISKFDLYKTEWLDLVFDGKNKAYGAYDLRKHYAKTMVTAMTITFLLTGLLFGTAMIFRKTPPALIHTTIVEVTPPAPIAPIKKIDPPAPVKAKPSTPAPPVATTAAPPPVVKPDNQVVDKMPDLNDLKTAIGPTTTKGKDGPQDIPVTIDNGTGGTVTPTIDNSVHSTAGLDVLPEPVGGEAAWAKFLNKNLSYPAEEREQGISGRVIMSFVIEKDGHLTDIKVVRSAGDDFDKEALRVLKLAKAWKPGMQNGQPVRVSYMIPISFQISSDSN